ncbi:MAG: glycosyltransferase family 4 protein [Candidatus Krumholzibacteriota bacterium]|nr:glycosyltransferase family 4 protein [Candidatus Krumholzibacteriota bacterium]
MPGKILIISYHFPPDLSVGAVRPRKFAEYLPRSGWDPIILTVHERHHDNIDSSGSCCGPEAKIFKAVKIPGVRSFFLSVKKKYLSLTKDEDIKQHMDEWNPPEQRSKEPIGEKLKRYFFSLFVFLPDDRAGWIFPAVVKGIWLILRYRIDVIYTTSPPSSSLVAGLILKTVTGKRWVTDFRDPWIGEMKPFFVRSRLSDKIELWLEKKVIEKSDHIVSVTPEMTERLRQRYPRLEADKFSTIWNGYDSSELSEFIGLEKRDEFTFTYAGSFYLGRSPRVFLIALANLMQGSGRIGNEQIRVRFIGDCHYSDGISIPAMTEELGLTDIVTFIPQISRDEAMIEMARSHILLLLAPDQPLQIPGKVYDYFGLKAYILAVCGPGASANILNDYDRVVVVPPGDVRKMENGIIEVIDLYRRAPEICEVDSVLEKYERSLLTEELVRKIDSADSV